MDIIFSNTNMDIIFSYIRTNLIKSICSHVGNIISYEHFQYVHIYVTGVSSVCKVKF